MSFTILPGSRGRSGHLPGDVGRAVATGRGFLPTLQQLGYEEDEVEEAMQDDPRGAGQVFEGSGTPGFVNGNRGVFRVPLQKS